MRQPALLMTVWLGAAVATQVLLPRLAMAAEDRLAVARQRMVAEQLAGPGRNITNALVLAAMGKVPRHEFVPERLRSQAYLDCPLLQVVVTFFIVWKLAAGLGLYWASSSLVGMFQTLWLRYRNGNSRMA